MTDRGRHRLWPSERLRRRIDVCNSTRPEANANARVPLCPCRRVSTTTNDVTNVRLVRKSSNINIIWKNTNVFTRGKSRTTAINVENGSAIRVNRTDELLLPSFIRKSSLGSYSQHINQRNKYCRPDQTDCELESWTKRHFFSFSFRLSTIRFC